MAKKKAITEQTTAEPVFEEALHKLETIVRRLEQGGGALDEALQDYAEAINLLKSCHRRLEVAERRIEILSGVDAQGNPITRQIEEVEITLEEKQQVRSQRRTAGGTAKPRQDDGQDLGLF